MSDDFDLPAFDKIGRQMHDAFFRSILSDPARAEALIRTHWPMQLRWMLEGEPPRPLDSALVRGDLSQLRTDALFLVGGQGQQPRAVSLPEHKVRAEGRTPGQIAGYRRTVRGVFRFTKTPWLVPKVFFTGAGRWTVPGAIDESAADPWEILRQMQGDEWYFLRQTRAIDYERLSCEPVSRAMLGMMGLAGRSPYPRDELRRMWRDVAAGCVVGETLLRQILHFVLATSALSQEELLELALETGLVNREEKMNLIIQPLIRDALRKGISLGLAKGISQGRSEGLSQGRSEGLSEGRSAGLSEGRLEGLSEGRSAGLSEGRLEGLSEGRSAGMSRILLKLVVRERFGPVPEVIEQKVRSATPSELEAWASTLLHAQSIDDVFGSTAGNQNGR